MIDVSASRDELTWDLRYFNWMMWHHVMIWREICGILFGWCRITWWFFMRFAIFWLDDDASRDDSTWDLRYFDSMITDVVDYSSRWCVRFPWIRRAFQNWARILCRRPIHPGRLLYPKVRNTGLPHGASPYIRCAKSGDLGFLVLHNSNNNGYFLITHSMNISVLFRWI